MAPGVRNSRSVPGPAVPDNKTSAAVTCSCRGQRTGLRIVLPLHRLALGTCALPNEQPRVLQADVVRCEECDQDAAPAVQEAELEHVTAHETHERMRTPRSCRPSAMMRVYFSMRRQGSSRSR